MARTLHGYTRGGKPPEYYVWSEMVRRCTNPNNVSFKWYGARGITVCDRWRDYGNFIEDVGPRPAPDYTLDRIDNEKGYQPGNVRWTDKRTQSANRRMAIKIMDGDEVVCLKEYCRRHGLNYGTVSSRIKRDGWPVEKAVTPGVRPFKRGEATNARQQ